MNSVLFFNASLIFLAACIVLGFIIQAWLFFSSKRPSQYHFEFAVFLGITAWQASMLLSLSAIQEIIFFADALSYALGILATTLIFFLSRSLRGMRGVKIVTVISSFFLMFVCFLPNAIIKPAPYTSAAEHFSYFGQISTIYYVYIVTMLICAVFHLLKATKIKSFATSRSLLFVFCSVVIINCAFNVFFPFLLAPVLRVGIPVVNGLQALASGCTSVLFLGFLYTSIAYEYLDTQLSIQKRLVYSVVVIMYIALAISLFLFCEYVLRFGPLLSICIFIVLCLLLKKCTALLQQALDVYFFFDTFDHQAVGMKEIDAKLGCTNYQKLIDDIRKECETAGISVVHLYISFRDQYTLKDIFSHQRISETDPCILGVYHLPGNFFTLDTLCLLRHRYIRSIEKRMKKSKADMLFVCHSGSAVVGCLFFRYSTGMAFSHPQREALTRIESRIITYLTYREALFAARNSN